MCNRTPRSVIFRPVWIPCTNQITIKDIFAVIRKSLKIFLALQHTFSFGGIYCIHIKERCICFDGIFRQHEIPSFHGTEFTFFHHLHRQGEQLSPCRLVFIFHCIHVKLSDGRPGCFGGILADIFYQTFTVLSNKLNVHISLPQIQQDWIIVIYTALIVLTGEFIQPFLISSCLVGGN